MGKIYGLLKSHYEKMSKEEQDRARQVYESKQKVKAIQNYIVEECRKQGFTIGEMSVLAKCLKLEANARRMRPWGEPF